jgi:hypothetical protein
LWNHLTTRGPRWSEPCSRARADCWAADGLSSYSALAARTRGSAGPQPHSHAMPVPDRHRLLFGPYRTPVFKYGDVVICDVRGQVEIVGLSAGRIPWPVGKRGPPPVRGHVRELSCRDLVEARGRHAQLFHCRTAEPIHRRRQIMVAAKDEDGTRPACSRRLDYSVMGGRAADRDPSQAAPGAERRGAAAGLRSVNVGGRERRRPAPLALNAAPAFGTGQR